MSSETERLRRVAMGLAADLDVAATTREALRLALEAVDAPQGVLALLTDDGSLQMVHSVGFSPEAVERFGLMRPGVRVPITDAIAEGRVLIVDETQRAFEARYPALAGLADRVGHARSVAVPLIVAGQAVGGIALRMPRERPLAPDFESFVGDVALQCGLAIHRAQLAERHRSSVQRLGMLVEASRVFAAASPDFDAVLSAIGEHVAKAFGGSCTLSLVTPTGTHLEHLFVHHEDPGARTQLQSLMRREHTRLGHGILGTVAATSKPILVPRVSAEQLQRMVQPGYEEFLARFPIRSLLVVPLRLSVRTLGTIGTSRYGDDAPFTAADQSLLEDFADRAAMAIENARLYTRERQARQAAESAMSRTRHLQRLTEALLGAQTTERVAEIVVEASADVLGAAASFGWLLSPDGKVLKYIASRGYDGPVLERIQEIPMDAKLPLCEVVRTGVPLVFGSWGEIESRFPGARRGSDFKSWALLPLWVAGRGIGAVSVSYSEPRVFQQEDREQLISMTAQAALAFSRCQLFEAEQAARARAEDADRRKDEFLALLSHELRNPLAPIQTALQLLRLRGEESALRERSLIERQVAQLERLVEELLDLSRVTHGRVELHTEWLDFAALVRRALEQVTPLIEERGHHLTVAIPHNDLGVEGDPARLLQVVVNLLDNAARCTPPGGLLHVAAAQERDSVVLRVRDSGAGIAPELLPHIFDPFAEAPQVLARAQGGLGLGLAIVQRLVALHGGEVAAHSEGPGRGSELVVRLPSARADVSRPAVAAPRDADPLPPAQQRLLIVDDNRDAAEILAEGLAMVGYEVRVTHDGPAALAVASSFRPALVLLDLGLPEMDGYEVAARLRGQPHGGALRLIALTGHGQNTDRSRTRAAGFDEHLVKPVSLERLAAVLARLAPGADAS